MDPRTQQEEEAAEGESLVQTCQRGQVNGPRLEDDAEEGEDCEDGDREGYAYDPAERRCQDATELLRLGLHLAA